ncbi:Crp/Fnr family transcriptional regulator [Bradyrhizobium sp.]|uniref:Crp/Fnr family transcriptional regulator n=1 Tax=Bradyrhizobium sp. TaxID=376 RepID=UPI003BAF8268
MIAELRARLAIIGRVQNNAFDMPMTQEQLGEALGVTAVHANRIIKQLRDDNVVDFHRGRVTIRDEAKLQELADFDRRYLHQKPTL